MTARQSEKQASKPVSYSKAFDVSMGILLDEIELAEKWQRPSILLAVHETEQGRLEAQKTLEKKILQMGRKVEFIQISAEQPDVIRAMSETDGHDAIVFFITGLEEADRASGGNVFRALNFRRELVVEEKLCAVFWVNPSEAEDLPRAAPDFWAFRHRVVDFAPKRGSKNQIVPAGIFLWEDPSPHMPQEERAASIKYYADSLENLPKDISSVSTRVEFLAKLAYYCWLGNDLDRFNQYVADGLSLMEAFPINHYQSLLLNARGIGLFEASKKEDAIFHFQQVLEVDPSSALGMMNASLAMCGLGRNREAVRTGTRVMENEPRNAHLKFVFGYLLLFVGQAGDALRVLAELREMQENYPGLHELMAVAYYKNHQAAESSDEMMIAEQLESTPDPIQKAVFSILRGNKASALEVLRQALRTNEIGGYQLRRSPSLGLLLEPEELGIDQ